jgi:uncharacterized membrane protein
MRDEHIQWLREELPTLVEQGVLTAEAAEQLRRHYGAPGERAGRRWALSAFSVFGALLIGAGIISLLAYNWASFPRAVRAALSFAPLLIGQAAGLRVLLRPRPSSAAREGAATFLMLTVGASLALVSQTYHLPGDFGAFTLTWMLLSLPLVYIFRASAPALFYLVGITGWACNRITQHAPADAFWALALAVAPHVYAVARANRFGLAAVFLVEAAAVCLLVFAGFATAWWWKPIPFQVFSWLLGLYYLVDACAYREAPGARQRPLRALGVLGILALAFPLTWRAAIGEAHWLGEPFRVLGGVSGWILTGLAPAAVLALLGWCVARRRWGALLFGAFPIVGLVGNALAHQPGWRAGVFVYFNAYVFVLGLGTLVAGVRARRAGTVNGGLVLLGALIAARFFDLDIGFVLKGVVFILLGIGFLASNLALARRRRRAA